MQVIYNKCRKELKIRVISAENVSFGVIYKRPDLLSLFATVDIHRHQSLIDDLWLLTDTPEVCSVKQGNELYSMECHCSVGWYVVFMCVSTLRILQAYTRLCWSCWSRYRHVLLCALNIFKLSVITFPRNCAYAQYSVSILCLLAVPSWYLYFNLSITIDSGNLAKL